MIGMPLAYTRDTVWGVNSPFVWVQPGLQNTCFHSSESPTPTANLIWSNGIRTPALVKEDELSTTNTRTLGIKQCGGQASE